MNMDALPAFLLWVTPILGVSGVVLITSLEYYKRKSYMKGQSMTDVEMNDLFNNLALKVESLVEVGRMDEDTGQSVLESLIAGLDMAGWTYQDDSLSVFRDIPFIVRAFETNGHKVNIDE